MFFTTMSLQLQKASTGIDPTGLSSLAFNVQFSNVLIKSRIRTKKSGELASSSSWYWGRKFANHPMSQCNSLKISWGTGNRNV